MKPIRHFTGALVLALIVGGAAAQDVEISKEDYIIYSAKTKKVVKPQAIIEDFKDYDVLFYGEEHNDSITHLMQALLFQLMHKNYGSSTVLSMEMFDRDVQFILDEYLSGKIKESYFNKDSRQWTNYRDYKPMVEFAKENKLDVIAANAPFRYVSIANKQGQQALQQLSQTARNAIAPLPYDTATGPEYEKLLGIMGMSLPKKDTSSSDTIAAKTTSSHRMSFNINQGQSLWNATMAWSIYQHKKAHPDARILHLNGRFHSEEHFGIVQRLNGYDPNIKPLVITGVASDKSFPDVDFEEYAHLGDYIIFTNPKLKKTY